MAGIADYDTSHQPVSDRQEYVTGQAELTIGDLRSVKENLKKAYFDNSNWKALGQQLGLQQRTLNVIDCNNPKNTDECYDECLTKWLQRADDVDKYGIPKYSSLAAALDKMDMKDVANEIRKLTCTTAAPLVRRHSRIDSHKRMTNHFDKMEMEFRMLLPRLQKIYSEKGITNDKIKEVLYLSLPSHLKCYLQNQSKIEDIFEVVKKKCNIDILKVEPLEVIVKELKVEEAVEIVQSYSKMVTDFFHLACASLGIDEETQAVDEHLKCTFVLACNDHNADALLKELEPFKNLQYIETNDGIPGQCIVSYNCPDVDIVLLIAIVLEKKDALKCRGLKEFRIEKLIVWNCVTKELNSIMVGEKPFREKEELEQTLAQKQIEELEKSLSDVKTQHAESTEKLETQKKLSKGMIQEIELLKHRNKDLNEKLNSMEKLQSEKGKQLQISAEKCTPETVDETHEHISFKDLSSEVAKLILSPLLKRKSVKQLHIASTLLKDDCIHLLSLLIANNDSLESLLLTHETINDEGVKYLAHSLKINKKLTYLSLESNLNVTSDSARDLADLVHTNPTLVLNLSHTKLDVNEVNRIVETLNNEAKTDTQSS